MNDDLPPWVTDGIPDDPSGPIGPAFTVPHGASAVYDYCWPDGFPAFKVIRFDINGHGKKRFQQWSLDGQAWAPHQSIPAGERPLFGIQDALHDFGASILVVEGEKTALAARGLVPADWVVVTWAGGASAPETADWAPIQGRDVVIWPDNDAPGHAAAKKIAAKLSHARVVDVPLSFPEGWDLADSAPPGWDQKTLITLMIGEGTATKDPDPAPPPIVPDFTPTPDENATFEDPITWDGQPIESRRWLVPDFIPIGTPTLFSGHGGTGKSLLSLQLAHAAATSRQWLGLQVNPVSVLAVLCEDDKPEVMRRLYGICQATETTFGDLENLHFLLRDGLTNILMTYDGQFTLGAQARFYDFMLWQARRCGAQLIILDSLYNFFAGDQNSQTQVHQFVNLLKRLAKEIDGSVVLLGHPSKSALSSGEGYSGSVVWHDAVRSRLYLNEEDGPDGKRLLLKTMKANYGPKNVDIELLYDNGVFRPVHDATGSDPIWRKSHCETTFLDCLREIGKQGRHVTDAATASNFAPKVFTGMDISRGFKRDEFKKAMERLFNDGRIKKDTIMSKNRKLLAALVEVNLQDDLNVTHEE